MRLIDSDESGDISVGDFYYFDVMVDPLQFEDEVSADCVLKSNPDQLYEWAEVVESPIELECRCPLDSTHVTGENLNPEKSLLVDLYAQNQLSYFIPGLSNSVLLVTEEFCKLLRKSGLSGAVEIEASIRINQSDIAVPRLKGLYFTGRMLRRPWIVTIPTPNSCPFCNYSPIVCPACHDFNVYCPQCNEHIIVSDGEHGGPDDPRFTATDVMSEDRILESTTWDGSDFIWDRYITKRALDWMLSVNAAPFFARPCRINVAEPMKGVS